MDERVFRSVTAITDRFECVGSGVMGSDGFESKKLGGPPSGGTGQNRLGPGEFSAGAERDPAMDALSGLGDAAANLVEISGVIKWFDASKATASSFPTMAGPTCCCTSPCCAATAIRPPMKARASWSNACSAPRATRRSGSSRWTNRPRSIRRRCCRRAPMSASPRPPVWSGRRSSGSTGCAGSAS